MKAPVLIMFQRTVVNGVFSVYVNVVMISMTITNFRALLARIPFFGGHNKLKAHLLDMKTEDRSEVYLIEHQLNRIPYYDRNLKNTFLIQFFACEQLGALPRYFMKKHFFYLDSSCPEDANRRLWFSMRFVSIAVWAYSTFCISYTRGPIRTLVLRSTAEP